MSSLCAIIPVANTTTANDALALQGFGSQNFSVPLYVNGSPSFVGLHTWHDTAFVTAVKAIANVIWEESTGDPTTRFNALANANSVKWGANAPDYPTTGTILPNEIYRYTDGNLYQVIQQYDVVTFPLPPSSYPALIVLARDPYQVYEWYQTGQFDAFKLVNPVTNKPDECYFDGKHYKVTQADGAGNNTWSPTTFGWSEV